MPNPCDSIHSPSEPELNRILFSLKTNHNSYKRAFIVVVGRCAQFTDVFATGNTLQSFK